MILANGCSHTHGTDHAVKYNYRDELWPNIMGKLIGDEDVLNIARPGDASQGIAESTIYWMETNSVKPDMVVIQWTYSNRGLLPAPWNPYHYKASNDGSSYKFYKSTALKTPETLKIVVFNNQFEGINRTKSNGLLYKV